MSDHVNLNHASNHPPPYFRPNNIDRPMDQNTIAYIETAMPPPPPLAQAASTPAHVARPQSQSHDADGPHGVLKRNQACKACRKRKLKCDAVKPHCSTCVRSYKHLLRTSPKSNPVLTCEYDDGVYETAVGSGLPGQVDLTGVRSHSHASPAVSEEDDEGRKRKRKSGISRPRDSAGIGDEREALMQRIGRSPSIPSRPQSISVPLLLLLCSRESLLSASASLTISRARSTGPGQECQRFGRSEPFLVHR